MELEYNNLYYNKLAKLFAQDGVFSLAWLRKTQTCPYKITLLNMGHDEAVIPY